MPWESQSNTSTKTANSHIKDNGKLHIRPDTQDVYAASPGSKSEIEGILFQELPTKIDDNQ